MKRMTAWIITAAIVSCTVLSGASMTDAYTITGSGGTKKAAELSEPAASALDEVSVTDREMLDDVVERSYDNDFQKKTYIVRTDGEEPDTTHWKNYVRSMGDFSIKTSWSMENTAVTEKHGYYTVTMTSSVNFSPFDYDTRTVKRWDEYSDRIRDVENRIGILNDSLCDYQKIQLAYIWIKQNIKYGTLGHVSVSQGQEPIEAVLDGYAMCAGYTRTFNRFMHDCGIESHYVSNASHAWNLARFENKYYKADCQASSLTCDEGYEKYNNNGKLLWYMDGLFKPMTMNTFLKTNEHEAIQFYNSEFINSEESPDFIYPVGPLPEITEPTCTTDGTFLKEGKVDEHCDYCGKIHSFTLPATHTYKTVERIPATCTTEGSVKLVCSECGDEKTETIEKKTHDYAIEMADATYDEEGYFRIRCKSCGDIHYAEYTDRPERPTPEETTAPEEPVTMPAYQEGDLERKDRGYGIITWYDAEMGDWYCMQKTFEMSMRQEVKMNGEFTDGLWVETGTLDTGRLYDFDRKRWINAGDEVDCYFDMNTHTWKIYMKYYTSDPQTTAPGTGGSEQATTRREQVTTGKTQQPATTKPAAEPQATTKPAAKPQTTTAPEKAKKPGMMKLTAKNIKGKKISLTWKKVTGATKYQVKLVLGKKKIRTKTTKKTKYTLTKLKKKKTYKVYIRACNTAGWGKWSRVKKVRVKK